MLRRLLLAVLVCLSMWALADGVAGAAATVGTPCAPAIVAALPDLPDDARGPAATWDATPPLSGGLTGASSTVRHPLQFVEPPGIARAALGWRVARLSSVTHRPAPSRAPHLHDIPLLI